MVQVLLAEPLGSLAFKMVQVQQLKNEQQVKLETSSWVLCLSKAYVFRVSAVFLDDWAVKMRIRPPELETSICDAKYHVSLFWKLSRSVRSDRRSEFIGYPRMSVSGESSTTMHRLLHASGSHPIPTPYDPK
ncbi:hypothetical protein F511_05610 [Dorcoceras hygrometricum]|uniref:Uncharacterized protein n=1 Tax=Dorcoceras hygrometricum TaxID=472368 RepID=A0A2Z7CPK9_9LAMI|nr:hypothetical protein F511_05610 [Dorcoceras hygrometricum]